MNRLKLIISILACILMLACAGPYSGPPADLVIKNAKIVTIDPSNRRAEAVAVIGEKIVAVTSNKAIEAYIREGTTRVIDAEHRLVIPGFNDAHLHFMSGGNSLLNLDFRYIDSIEKIQDMVARRVKQVKPGQLISGRGWDHELFPGKKWPTKEQLDQVAPDNPVALSRADGHSVWVNSYVIKQSGITRQTPDPDGGTIVRDPQTGEPTGIFKESAKRLLAIKDAYPLSPQDKQEQSVLALEKSFERARQTGVTSISHLNGNQDLLQQFYDTGRLTARVTFNMWLTADKTELAVYDSLRKAFPPENNWIRAGYLKGFMDGTLGSGTAFMFEPFTDDTTTSGLPQMPYSELVKKVVCADSMGFQVGIHAIGTRANHWILNAYEEAQRVNGNRDSRHRSEHAQILTDDDIPRFKKLGVIASMQPTHCITDKRFAEKRLGRARCTGAYAWQRLLDAGAHVAFGTDWPVEPLNPMEGLYAAVTRKDRGGEPGKGWFPDQKLSMEKAIELYTSGSAYAEFTEKRKGRIKKGFLADMVILDQDLFSIPPEKIMDTKVDMTIVGGAVVFSRE